MQVAVITPYYKEDIGVIRFSHESVLAQDLSCTHVLVADGFPRPSIDGWACEHLTLPKAHEDKGDFARGVGAMHAINAGADFVTFLDADNWLEPNHISSLVVAALTNGTAVTTSRRSLRRPDGSVLDALDPESDGERFADTGTILFHRSLIDIVSLWMQMPRTVGGIGDQIVWSAIKARRYPHVNTGAATLNYRTSFACHYHARNEVPPAGATDLGHVRAGEAAWAALNDHQRRCLLTGY